MSHSQLEILTAALNQSTDSILITDAELDAPGPRIVYVNHAHEKTTGYSAEELIGQSPRILQGPKTDRALLQKLTETLREGRPFHGETVNYRREGTPYWVEWDIAPVRGDAGDIDYFISIQRDVTHRKQAEQSLERAMDALKKSNERQRQVSGVLAHDLKDPLATVSGYLDFIRTIHGTSLNERTAEYVDQALEAVGRMIDKVTDLIQEAHDLSSDDQTVELDEVLAQAIVDVQAALRASNADLKIEPLPRVAGRPAELREIFQNLLSNALKYRHPNRTPRIAVRAAAVEADAVVIEVADNGIGIAAEDQPRIFDSGYRSFDVEETPGSGLGLHYVRRAVERLGGWISVHSTPGDGSAFRVVLRAAPGCQAASPRSSLICA